MPCNYILRREGSLRVAVANCEDCNGPSSLLDGNCRKNIFEMIKKEANLDRIVLNHSFVKVFDGEPLSFLKDLADFLEELDSHDFSKISSRGKEGRCTGCIEDRIKRMERIKEIAPSDPILAFQKLTDELHYQKGYKKERKPGIIGAEYAGKDECAACRKEYAEALSELVGEKGLTRKIVGNRNSEFYYRDKIQPYVRPMFFDTYIKLTPPSDSVFIKKYGVKREGGRVLSVSLYSLSLRPEKLYFIIPPEYNLPATELKVLQKVKEKLARHRPQESSFMDPETSREYFLKFARETINEVAEEEGLMFNNEKLETLSDIFAKYTAGFGILEDLLLDEKIQDIYINAPVANNPLHIILEGEEYTSNIYFSEGDVEALSSRFRSLSGRPFSEGAPILDMELGGYGARIAAISPPLTAKGVAFAIRRHGSKPWTLPKFITYEMFSPTAAALLSFLVDGQASILISGSRGSGKTSLLSALLLEIPQRYRILTLEDTPELPVEQLQKLGYKMQSLVTRPITSGGSSGVDPKTALRTALRLGESVLVLGEVRGEETKVLFEAMRVGAAGNLILGTIHGATTRDVFERIVYDIGVAPTSFKATDIVVIAAPIRIGGGMEKKRRVIQISEVTKSRWGENVDADKIFADIMRYNPAKDELEATDLLDMGQSEIIGRIAKEWGMNIEMAIENISLRTKIRKKIVEYGKKRNELLEARSVRDCNNAFWVFTEESRREHGIPDYKEIEKRWMEWFKEYAGKVR
ncbi:MAG: type II/IV secretion system ATPase subunit [Candidatus Thermoplasmatota archaeon]|nr:type II/IV secretion system ATPase subunit [Candidatus Thermoplasmatota archaeon]